MQLVLVEINVVSGRRVNLVWLMLDPSFCNIRF